jgi:cysteine desulfurase/selenocysteine lyase
MNLSRFKAQIPCKLAKNNFPIFSTHPDLAYLDSASTTQTPQIVLEAMNNYYTNYRANIHRGLYDMSVEATEEYEAARAKVAEFINAQPDEVIFTSGTTHGLNLLAHSLAKNLTAQDNVVLTCYEHHANLIPWQEMSKRYGFELRFIDITAGYELDLDSAKKLIDSHTKIASFASVSNSLGITTPVEALLNLAKQNSAITIIDAAQSIAHSPADVKKLDVDFLVFSGHKMYGPTGIGVLYGKQARLEQLEPLFFGGDMIKEVNYERAIWDDAPRKFEASTPNIAGAIGLGAAITFIENTGWETIQKNEQTLRDCFFKQKPDFIKIIGPDNSPERSGVISFTIDGVHPHDVAEILNSHDVAVRAGHHCAMPLMKKLNVSGTTRISFGVYNSTKDIDQLHQGLQEVARIFKLVK